MSNTEGTPITGLGGQCRRGANNYVHRSKHKSSPVSRLTTAYYLLFLWHTHTHTRTRTHKHTATECYHRTSVGTSPSLLGHVFVCVTAIIEQKRQTKMHHVLLHQIQVDTLVRGDKVPPHGNIVPMGRGQKYQRI